MAKNQAVTDRGAECRFQVLFCRLRYKLSYRETAELFLLRGWVFTHEAVRDWEERFTPVFAEELRAKRKGNVSQVWHVDETYLKIKGQWCYLYRAMDQNGNLVDTRLSKQRDMAALPKPSLPKPKTLLAKPKSV